MEHDQSSGWRTLDSKLVHATPWFEVRRDAVVRPDGVEDVYQHVVAPASVTVLAVDTDGRVVLTKQWIYTHGGTQWRLPGGGVDPDDLDPSAAARRELAEETGLRAARWESIGKIHDADSFTNHVDHVFLASELVRGPSRLGPGEVNLDVHWLPFDDALSMVTGGEITHAGSAYALLLRGLFRAAASKDA